MVSPNVIINELAKRVNDSIRRIRILEERLRNLDKIVNSFEQSFINEIKEVYKRIEENRESVKLATDKLTNIEVDIQNIKKDLKKLVSYSEIKELQNYIELIKPITTKFVTRKEVEEMIEEKL